MPNIAPYWWVCMSLHCFWQDTLRNNSLIRWGVKLLTSHISTWSLYCKWSFVTVIWRWSSGDFNVTLKLQNNKLIIFFKYRIEGASFLRKIGRQMKGEKSIALLKSKALSSHQESLWKKIFWPEDKNYYLWFSENSICE